VVQTTNADWDKGIWAAPNVLASAQNPSPYVTHVKSGTDAGNATVEWSKIAGAMGILGGDHWFYEVEIPVSVFGAFLQGDNPSQAFEVQWTMDCANDIISLGVPTGVTTTTVPEPGALALFWLGAGMLMMRRRKRAHA